MTQAAMAPYKRTPPPLPTRFFFATMLVAMGPVYWFLQRFKLDGKLFGAMRERQRKELKTKNPFKGYRAHGTRRVRGDVCEERHQLDDAARASAPLSRQGRVRAHSLRGAWPDTDLMGPMRATRFLSGTRASGRRRPRGSVSSRRTSGGRTCRTRPKAKYIIVIRDPKDVFVSSYYFFVKDGPLSFTNMSVAAFLETFLSDQFFMGGSWASTTAAYWAQRDKPNVLICSFKEMRRDLAGSVQPRRGVPGRGRLARDPAAGDRAVVVRLHEDDRRQVQHGQVPVAAIGGPEMMRKGERGELVGADHARAGTAHRRVLHRAS